MPPATRPGRRITSLDGLRGLAALVVAVQHGLIVNPTLADGLRDPSAPLPTWAQVVVHTPVHLVWAGNEAVYVFFVLSGLVLTLPYVGGRRPDWRAYYPSRFLRLYGPVFVALLFAMALFVLVPHEAYPGQSWWIARHQGTLDLKVAAFALPLLAHISMLNSPLWTLRWELGFSLLLPIYLYGVRAMPSVARGGLLVVIAAATVWGPSWAGWLAMFGVGVLLAFERERVERWVGALPTAAGAVLTVVAALLLIAQWSPVPVPHVGLLLAVVGAGLLVALFAAWPPLERCGDRRVLQWLGGISFSFYLVHEPIMVALAFLLRTSNPLLVLGLGLPLGLVAGWAFHRAVESPLHRLAQAVGRRAGRGSPVATGGAGHRGRTAGP